MLLVDFLTNGHTGGEGIKSMEFDLQANLGQSAQAGWYWLSIPISVLVCHLWKG